MIRTPQRCCVKAQKGHPVGGLFTVRVKALEERLLYSDDHLMDGAGKASLLRPNADVLSYRGLII